MEKRLRLVRRLLKPDGVLVVTIDENEVHHLGMLLAWESLLRRGNVWYRQSRPNLCYPVILDEAGTKIVGVGEPFKGNHERKRPKSSIKGRPLAWPVRKDGKLGIWRVDGDRLLKLAERGLADVSSRDDERGTWTVQYLMTGTIHSIEKGDIVVVGHGPRGQVTLEQKATKRTTAKTLWHRGRHTAGGAGGTQLLAALLGERAVFSVSEVRLLRQRLS